VSDKALHARLEQASAAACRELGIDAVTPERLNDALGNSVDPQRLLDSLAEAWRTSNDVAKKILTEHGFGALLARLQVDAEATGAATESFPPLSGQKHYDVADGSIRVLGLNPAFDDAVSVASMVHESVQTPFDAFRAQAESDPLGVLYRKAPLAYARDWLTTTGKEIAAWVQEQFGDVGPKYVVNSGIGANEMFNYFVASLANERNEKAPQWYLVNSPREMANLPPDARVENTLFMEFSRSGITEETVKLHECTPANAKRIVFSNSGTLRELGVRDGNLVLELPSEVSGRYGRNKTPILMAPMFVCGMDVDAYWQHIEAAAQSFDLTKPDALPAVMAKFIRLQQLHRGVNHIYLGSNDERLRFAADEFCQYWNEGVNRDGNDITMSRYLGLPRDSHMNLEAILGTAEHKLAIFLLRTGEFAGHDMLLPQAHPLDPDHKGLSPADVDTILALANIQRCSEKMPTLVIAVREPDLQASAWLGQLWADTTLVYSRLIGVDPGNNPEVKAVRTRAAGWLADKSAAMELLGGFQ